MRLLPLLLAASLSLAACAIPKPPPHGPVPPPVPAVLNARGLLEAVRADYPRAEVDVQAATGELRLSFGPGPSPRDVDAFVSAFLEHHSDALAAGRIGATFVPEGKEGSERIVFGHPLRDTGCRRIRLAFVFGPSGPESLHRRCERFSKAPPSYAGRTLPSTAQGSTDTLVRVGSVGGIAGPVFSGFVIDRFGDVYNAHDDFGPTNREPEAFLGDYVKTLPPAEVEQFAFDVSLVAGEKEEPDDEPAVPDGAGAVVQSYLGPSGQPVNLPSISASAARRAAHWARTSVGRR